MTQNDLFFFIVVVLMALLASPGLVMVGRSLQRSDRMVTRLENRKAGNRPTKEKKHNRAKSLGEIASSLGSRAMPGNEKQMSVLRFKLMRAGYLSPKAISIYMGVRLIAIILPLVLLIPFLPTLADMHEYAPLGSSLLLVALGIFGPEKYIGGRTKKQEAEYREGFPDMMDLMVACVEAGMSIDAAVSRVAEELITRYPNLSLHLNIIALEVRAGRSRHDAWKNFGQRLGLDEADSLATMLRQAEEMGSSVGDTLRVFSKDMRQKRMLAAEELALGLSAKLSLPLILFVFPTLLGVLILPAVVRALDLSGS